MFNIKDGFDIVIGNPPYVEAKKLKEVVALIKQYYVCYSGTADLSVYFYEKGLSLCKKNGFLTYICTNKFFNTGYGRRLRAFILSHSLRQILNFEQCEVFENVLVSSVIIIIRNNASSSEGTIKFKNWYKLNRKDFLCSFQHNKSKLQDYPLSVLSADEWSFSDIDKLKLKTKIEQGNTLIGNIDGGFIFRGVTTGYNPAFIISDKKRDEFLAVNAINSQIIKKLLQGKNIRKWYYTESIENLLFIPWHFPFHKDKTIAGASQISEKIFACSYPDIYAHLLQHKELLLERNSAETGIRYEWYALQRCAASYYEHFERDEKIIWGLTADKWAFAYDDRQHYLPSNGYILTSTTLPIKYILGILNSKVLEFYFSFIGVMTAGGAYTLKHDTISKLPFPSAGTDEQQSIIADVDNIITAKVASPSADTTDLERKIDEKVYKLYGLTSKEDIAIIESSLKKDKAQKPAHPPEPSVDAPAEDDDDADDS